MGRFYSLIFLDGLFEVEILVMHFVNYSHGGRQHANQVQNNKDHAKND